MKNIKVMSIFGTRPEAIKMCPLVLELEKTAGIDSIVAVTAQHREMLDQVLECFGVVPDYDLNLMKHGQTLASVTSDALTGLMGIIEEAKPDLLLVHGDTTTTFVGALAAFYSQIPCGHVEAGLRTFDKYAPYPEEANRCLTGVLADLHFAPTAGNKANLLASAIKEENIYVTGNTVIDALLEVTKKDCDLADFGLANVDWTKKVVLLTCHRRENWGEPMEAIFSAIRDVKAENDAIEIVFPVHKNPLVQNLAKKYFADMVGVHLIEPLEYLPFSHLIEKSYLVLTDSGGLQEEAPALGKPVLVLREVTERPEAVAAGTAALIGNTYDSVKNGVNNILENDNIYAQMAHAANPYGDGTTSKQIAKIILEKFAK